MLNRGWEWVGRYCRRRRRRKESF